MTLRRQLLSIVLVFSFLMASLIFMSYATIRITSAVRSYVLGEAHWSRAQKNSIYYLIRYLQTSESQDYDRFVKELIVPKGDSIARREMLKDDTDFEIVDRGLIQGNNDPESVRDMGRLFKYFRGVSYLKACIDKWTRADEILAEYEALGAEIHARVSKGPLSSEDRRNFLIRVDEINDALTDIEFTFSQTMEAAAKWLARVLMWVNGATVILFLLMGMAFARFISRGLLRDIEALHAGTERLRHGDLKAHIQVLSHNELGDLARSFNEMTTSLARAETLRIERDKANEANQAKSVFLANMSHELRTPMHGILSYARFGLTKIATVSPDTIKSYFEEIHDSGMRLMRLLNDLLDLSKLESKQIELALQHADFVQTAEVVLAELQALVVEKNLSLEFEKTSPELPALLDPQRIQQVLRNLLVNAIKFSHPGTVVKLTVRTEHESLRFEVRNRGVSIPEAELETIFDKFVQSSKTKTGAGGTGLGLSICKQIVQLHNGEIWAVSSPDADTVFHVSIPLQPGLAKSA